MLQTADTFFFTAERTPLPRHCNRTESQAYLENEVLNLKEKLIPLSTSYTESGKSPGRPELPAEQKSEKTIANEKSLDGGGSSTNG